MPTTTSSSHTVVYGVISVTLTVTIPEDTGLTKMLFAKSIVVTKPTKDLLSHTVEYEVTVTIPEIFLLTSKLYPKSTVDTTPTLTSSSQTNNAPISA